MTEVLGDVRPGLQFKTPTVCKEPTTTRGGWRNRRSLRGPSHHVWRRTETTTSRDSHRSPVQTGEGVRGKGNTCPPTTRVHGVNGSSRNTGLPFTKESLVPEWGHLPVVIEETIQLSKSTSTTSCSVVNRYKGGTDRGPWALVVSTTTVITLQTLQKRRV